MLSPTQDILNPNFKTKTGTVYFQIIFMIRILRKIVALEYMAAHTKKKNSKFVRISSAQKRFLKTQNFTLKNRVMMTT